MNEHTPGPWHVEHDDQFGRSYVCHPETVCTATTVCEIETPRRQADARLIAAAPELLAALKACTEVLAIQYQTRRRNGGAGQQAYDKARAAIAKARAQEPTR